MEDQNNNIMENQISETSEQPVQKSSMSTSEPKSTGSIIGAIIIIIVLIIGGLYFWGQELDQKQTIDKEILTEEIVPETTDIEADLDALNTEELDVELESIDLELSI